MLAGESAIRSSTHHQCSQFQRVLHNTHRLAQLIQLTPAFKEMRDGKPKMISFLAKKARGMMARFIIDNRIETPEELKAFNMGGYAYDSASSDDTTWTFIR